MSPSPHLHQVRSLHFVDMSSLLMSMFIRLLEECVCITYVEKYTELTAVECLWHHYES
jgi:hypothetical protein